MKTKLFGFCLVGLIGMINGAYATGESTATTSQKYVDDALSGKQAILTAKTNDTIVTYPRTNGPAIVHEIKEEMGTSTSDTGIPTAETLESAIGEKIGVFVNLPNNNVVTYTGNGYSVTTTPIYDNSANTYGNGLVRASTLNSAVATAARAKFTQVNANGVADSNGGLWQINTVAPTLTVTKTLDPLVNGTDYCYRGLNGTNNRANGNCSAATQTALGASGSKTGKWGVVFPYGEVVGRSVCSNVKPTNAYYGDGEYDYNRGYITSSAETTTLNGQFTVQSGTGTPAEGYKYCYCKMDSVDGTDVSAVSRWVFNYSSSSASGCAANCAYHCGYYVQYRSDFRSGVFGSVAP